MEFKSITNLNVTTTRRLKKGTYLEIDNRKMVEKDSNISLEFNLESSHEKEIKDENNVNDKMEKRQFDINYLVGSDIFNDINTNVGLLTLSELLATRKKNTARFVFPITIIEGRQPSNYLIEVYQLDGQFIVIIEDLVSSNLFLFSYKTIINHLFTEYLSKLKITEKMVEKVIVPENTNIFLRTYYNDQVCFWKILLENGLLKIIEQEVV